MNLKDIALHYHNLGFSVLPCNANKAPIGKWKEAQEAPIEPTNQFNNCSGVGFACGKASGGLEVIDVDSTKCLEGHDVWEDIRNLFKQRTDIAKKLVIEKSRSGGKHIFYRCNNYEGNRKLASRYATKDELLSNPNEKVKCFLETRGAGGFIVVTPTEGYELIYGSFEKVDTLTDEERNWLIEAMMSLNQVKVNEVPKLAPSVQPKKQGVSVFDDYNLRGDIPQLLEDSGWTYVETQGRNMRYRRPNCATDSRTSADWHAELRLFHVFTSSTEFEPSKSYNPVQIFTMLNFGFLNKETYREASKLLRSLGFGEQDAAEDEIEKQIELEKTNNYLAEDDEIDQFIEDLRNNTVAMGVGIGLQSLDEYWVYKPKSFNMVGGISNIGKTDWMMWWMTILSKKHGFKWMIASMENEVGELIKIVMEYSIGKNITKMDDNEYLQSRAWAKQHFKVFSNKRTYTYKEILDAAQEELRKEAYAGLLIDPQSALELDTSELKLYGEYRYHYRSATQFRIFTQKTGCSVYLVAHPNTEANKRMKDGYQEAPYAADIEYGSMWQNRCDNSITLHRRINHPSEWMITEVHVRKIKAKYSGGNITKEPIRLIRNSNCTFQDIFGVNPLYESGKEPYSEEPPF